MKNSTNDFDWNEYAVDDYYQIKENNMLKLSWGNVKSALVYAIIAGLVADAIYMIEVGTVFALDWHMLVDGFVFGAITSIVKNLFTNDSGKFLGMVDTRA